MAFLFHGPTCASIGQRLNFIPPVCLSVPYLDLMRTLSSRFYDNVQGDFSDAFAFSEFFPGVLQFASLSFSSSSASPNSKELFPFLLSPVINRAGQALYYFFTLVKACPKVKQYNISTDSSISISIPGTSMPDAERRRQIALRDLNARLKLTEQSVASSATSPAPAQPTIEPPPPTQQQPEQDN
eukprot:m.160808 g.160808  ORF g.160808 m.160808 type:complete len:184 (+) comp53028_c0_seq37:570-1121(+)